MIPPEDSYPEAIAVIVSQLLAGDRAAAERGAAEFSYARREVAARRSLPPSLTVRVFRRDRWTCRYCGAHTIFTPVMALLSEVFPEHFPYHRNWKAGQIHPAVITRSAVIDHVMPGSLGGEWLAEGNLVTTRWPCNVRKGDLTLEQLGWRLQVTHSPVILLRIIVISRSNWAGAHRRHSWSRLPAGEGCDPR